jgi:hypothetical protein
VGSDPSGKRGAFGMTVNMSAIRIRLVTLSRSINIFSQTATNAETSAIDGPRALQSYPMRQSSVPKLDDSSRFAEFARQILSVPHSEIKVQLDIEGVAKGTTLVVP